MGNVNEEASNLKSFGEKYIIKNLNGKNFWKLRAVNLTKRKEGRLQKAFMSVALYPYGCNDILLHILYNYFNHVNYCLEC